MPHHEDDDLAEDTASFLRRKRKEALPPDSRCYTLPNGECISPFDCIHGDGVDLEEFLDRAITADPTFIAASKDSDRLDKIESCLCYMMVRDKNNAMISLPNNGDGWDKGKLRIAIDDAVTKRLI